MPNQPKKMKISIEEFSFKTIIGILPFERITPQKVILNIYFEYTFSQDIKDFCDYSEISNLVKKTMKKKKFELIEDAIISLEHLLAKKYNISNLNIKITKPTILKNCKVSVENI